MIAGLWIRWLSERMSLPPATIAAVPLGSGAVASGGAPGGIKEIPSGLFLAPEWTQRLTVIDGLYGNWLKVDRTGRPIIAYHGTERIENLDEVYSDPLDLDGLYAGRTERYRVMKSAFDVSLALVAPRVFDYVDGLIESSSPSTPNGALAPWIPSKAVLNAAKRQALTLKGQNGRVIYPGAYDEVMSAMDDFFMANFLDWENSWFFAEMRAHPEKYLHDRRHIRSWLHSLRHEHGRRLLLITNSFQAYTRLLMDFQFGPDWESLFDLVITSARKPAFFLNDSLTFYPSPHAEPSEQDYASPVSKLQSRGVYGGGSSAALEAALTDLADQHPHPEQAPENVHGVDTHPHSPPGVVHPMPAHTSDPHPPEHDSSVSAEQQYIYFGDHLTGDVASPVKVGWAAVGIVEELEELEAGLPEGKLDENKVWGSWFYAPHGELTFAAGLLVDHASTYVPDLAYFAAGTKPLAAAFRALHIVLPGDGESPPHPSFAWELNSKPAGEGDGSSHSISSLSVPHLDAIRGQTPPPGLQALSPPESPRHPLPIPTSLAAYTPSVVAGGMWGKVPQLVSSLASQRAGRRRYFGGAQNQQ